MTPGAGYARADVLARETGRADGALLVPGLLPLLRLVEHPQRGVTMPCKPAEYDFNREDGERAEERVLAAIEHRHVVRRLLLDYASDPALELPQALRGPLDIKATERPDRMPPRPEDANRDHYRYPKDGSWALEFLYRADREERWLCEARTLLLLLARIRPVPSRHRALFEQEREAHRAHRREDLEAVRTALRQRIRYFDGRRSNADDLASLRGKLARAERLTPDDILLDRSELESLWPR